MAGAALWILTVVTVAGLLTVLIVAEAGPSFSASSIALWYVASAVGLTGIRALCSFGVRQQRTRRARRYRGRSDDA